MRRSSAAPMTPSETGISDEDDTLRSGAGLGLRPGYRGDHPRPDPGDRCPRAGAAHYRRRVAGNTEGDPAVPGRAPLQNVGAALRLGVARTLRHRPGCHARVAHSLLVRRVREPVLERLSPGP